MSIYCLQSSSLILTVAVAGSVVAMIVLFSKRTVPTMSGSQAMLSFALDDAPDKPGMQRSSIVLPLLNRKAAVRVCGVSSPSNTLSAGRMNIYRQCDTLLLRTGHHIGS